MLLHEKRFFATVIDIGIVLVISLLINIFVPTNLFTNGLVFSIIYFIVGFVYTFLCLLISKDRTIGLYSMSLKLLNNDWSKPTSKSILLRSLTSGVLVLHFINMFYIILNKTTITLIDEISDSFVIKTGDVYNVND